MIFYIFIILRKFVVACTVSCEEVVYISFADPDQSDADPDQSVDADPDQSDADPYCYSFFLTF